LAVFLLSMGWFAPLISSVFGPAGSLVASPPWVQWVGAVILGFGLAWTSVEIRAFSLKIVVAVVALVETAALSWLLLLWGILWTPFTALAAGAFGTGFGLIYSLSGPGRRRRALETVLGGRISKPVFRRWLDSNEPLPFDGQQREASVVVCRIFNRGRIAGALASGDDVAFSKAFLQVGSQVLKGAGGVLTEGDGEQLVAVFGAVLPVPEHAAQACRAALTLRERLETLSQACQERCNVALEFGVAVHSGPVSVGALGNHFLVTGEPLDFCRRLCQANPTYGTRILAGQQAVEFSKGAVEVRPVELIWNHAAQTREEVYELLALQGGLSVEERARRELFWKGVILCRRKQWRAAAAQFEIVLRDTAAGDALVRFYLARAGRAAEENLMGDRFDETH
jgi:adenylate cyclase